MIFSYMILDMAIQADTVSCGNFTFSNSPFSQFRGLVSPFKYDPVIRSVKVMREAGREGLYTGEPCPIHFPVSSTWKPSGVSVPVNSAPRLPLETGWK